MLRMMFQSLLSEINQIKKMKKERLLIQIFKSLPMKLVLRSIRLQLSQEPM